MMHSLVVLSEVFCAHWRCTVVQVRALGQQNSDGNKFCSSAMLQHITVTKRRRKGGGLLAVIFLWLFENGGWNKIQAMLPGT